MPHLLLHRSQRITAAREHSARVSHVDSHQLLNHPLPLHLPRPAVGPVQHHALDAQLVRLVKHKALAGVAGGDEDDARAMQGGAARGLALGTGKGQLGLGLQGQRDVE